MAMKFSDLQNLLPPGAIEFVGNNQLKLNFNQLTGLELNPESILIQGVAQFLEGLVELTTAINEDRVAATPAQTPITFASKELSGSASVPVIRYTVTLQVDNSAFLSNLVDPTAPISQS